MLGACQLNLDWCTRLCKIVPSWREWVHGNFPPMSTELLSSLVTVQRWFCHTWLYWDVDLGIGYALFHWLFALTQWHAMYLIGVLLWLKGWVVWWKMTTWHYRFGWNQMCETPLKKPSKWTNNFYVNQAARVDTKSHETTKFSLQYMVRSVHPTTQPGLEVCVVSFEKPVAPQSSRRVEALAENKALAEVCWKWGGGELVRLGIFESFFKGILIQTKEAQNATRKHIFLRSQRLLPSNTIAQLNISLEPFGLFEPRRYSFHFVK